MKSIEIITDLMVKTDDFRNEYMRKLTHFMEKETTDNAAKLTFFYNTILSQLYYLVKNMQVSNQRWEEILSIKELLIEDFSEVLNKFILEEYSLKKIDDERF